MAIFSIYITIQRYSAACNIFNKIYRHNLNCHCIRSVNIRRDDVDDDAFLREYVFLLACNFSNSADSKHSSFRQTYFGFLQYTSSPSRRINRTRRYDCVIFRNSHNIVAVVASTHAINVSVVCVAIIANLFYPRV